MPITIPKSLAAVLISTHLFVVIICMCSHSLVCVSAIALLSLCFWLEAFSHIPDNALSFLKFSLKLMTVLQINNVPCRLVAFEECGHHVLSCGHDIFDLIALMCPVSSVRRFSVSLDCLITYLCFLPILVLQINMLFQTFDINYVFLCLVVSVYSLYSYLGAHA